MRASVQAEPLQGASRRAGRRTEFLRAKASTSSTPLPESDPCYEVPATGVLTILYASDPATPNDYTSRMKIPLIAPRASRYSADARRRRRTAPSSPATCATIRRRSSTRRRAKSLATLPTGEAPHEVATTHDGKLGRRQQLWNSRATRQQHHRDRPRRTLAVARTIDLGEYRRPHGMAFFPGDTLLAVTSEVSRAVLLVDFSNGTRDRHRTDERDARRTCWRCRRAGDELFTTNIADGSISRLDVAQAGDATVIPVAKQVEGIAISSGRQARVGRQQCRRHRRRRRRRDGPADRYAARLWHPVSAGGISRRRNGDRHRSGARRGSRLRCRGPPSAFAHHHPARRASCATAEVPGSPSPEGVTTSPDGRWAFVTLQGRNLVAMIDLESGKIAAYAPTGIWSDGIAFSSVETRVGVSRR